jgi:hypothetical protein
MSWVDQLSHRWTKWTTSLPLGWVFIPVLLTESEKEAHGTIGNL